MAFGSQYAGGGIATQTVITNATQGWSNPNASPLPPGDYLIAVEAVAGSGTVYFLRGTAHNTPIASATNGVPIQPGAGYQFSVPDFSTGAGTNDNVAARAWVCVFTPAAAGATVTLSRQDAAGLTTAPPALTTP